MTILKLHITYITVDGNIDNSINFLLFFGLLRQTKHFLL